MKKPATVTIPYNFNPKMLDATLRDHFAAIALKSLAHDYYIHPTDATHPDKGRMDMLAHVSYSLAAHMLSERKRWEADSENESA